jgi:hypothetical protein
MPQMLTHGLRDNTIDENGRLPWNFDPAILFREGGACGGREKLAMLAPALPGAHAL